MKVFSLNKTVIVGFETGPSGRGVKMGKGG